MKRPVLWLNAALLVAYIVAMVCLQQWGRRENFSAFLGWSAPAFVAYAGLLYWRETFRFRWLIAAAIMVRLTAFVAPPLLSNDWHRFVWDGRLQVAGISPFAYTPRQLVETSPPGFEADTVMFRRLNSPDYYSVYPPVAQGVYGLSAWLSPSNAAGSLSVMRFFLFLCEIGSIWFLWRIGGRLAALLYGLHPAPVLEVVSNVHFEGAVVCCMLAGFWSIRKQRPWQSGLWWAAAVASKLVPLMITPLIWAAWPGRDRWRYAAGLVGGLALFFMSWMNVATMRNIAQSVKLYVDQFEFNASVYYVLKFTANQFSTWDTGRRISPILMAAVAAFILIQTVILLLKQAKSAPPGEAEEFEGNAPPASNIQHPTSNIKNSTLQHFNETGVSLYLYLYLLLSTTVHPWYVLLPFGLGCLTRYRSPAVWAGVVWLSYSHYENNIYSEKWAWIIAEYALLAAVMAWDFRSICKKD